MISALLAFAPTALFSFTEFFGDINLVLKIFVLLTIISFVQNHLGRGALGLAVMGIFAWFILFDAWAFFGGVYLLYMLLMFGIAGVFVDFFFIGGGFGPQPQMEQQMEGHEAHRSGGAETTKRARAMASQHAAHAIGRAFRGMRR